MSLAPELTPARRLITRVQGLRGTRPDRAWRELSRAFRLASRGAAPAERGELWRLRGHVLRSLRRAADAARAYRVAERWYARAGESRERGRCAIGLVDALMYLGKYDEARRTAARGRRFLVAAKDAVSLGRLLNNEANVFHRLDRPEEALARYVEARRALTRAGDPVTARRYATNVANCLSLLGRTESARQHYDEAERAAIETRQPLDALRAAYNRAYLEFLDQRYEKSLKELEQVGREAAVHGYPSLAALARLDRAEILLHLGDAESARREGAGAAEACRALGLRYEAAKAQTFMALADFRIGLEARASRGLEAAILAFDAEGNRVWVGESLVGLATMWWRGGQPLAAAVLLGAALRHFRAAGDAEREGCALALLLRAWVAAGRPRAARRLLPRLDRIVRRQRSPRLLHLALAARAAVAMAAGDHIVARRTLRLAARESERLAARILDEQWRASFWGEWGWPHTALAALELDAGRSAAALEALEAGRGRTLLGAETLLRNESLRRRVRSWAAARHVHERARAARGSGAPALAPARHVPVSARLQRTLARRPSSVRAKDVRASLPEGTMLLDFMVHEGRVGLLTVNHEGFGGVAFLATENRVTSLVHALLFSLRSAAFQPPGERDAREAHEPLEKLAALLLWPALEGRAMPRALAIVPVGPLARVPWAALPLPDGRTLIEACEVTVVPGLRLGLSNSSARSLGSPLLVAVDGGELAHVSAETRGILDRFPEALILEGADATTERFLALAPTASWIHFAGHGIYDPETPQLSGLRFADRWLPAAEMGSLRLAASRVTLSACQTARALVRPGEEWFGLPRTLLLAGAGSVIASQWDVDDAAARRWMDAFYERIAAGEPEGQAVRGVQAGLCGAGVHPLDWAGFVRLGGPSAGAQS